MESCLTDRISKQGEKEDAGNEPGVHMRMFEQTAETGAFPKKTYTKWFDYDIIKSTVKIRHKEPGDYITIDRNGGTQSLKKYFINAKIRWKTEIRSGRQQMAVTFCGLSDTDRTRRIRLQIRPKGFWKKNLTEEKKMAETVKVLVPEEDVAKRIKELGEQISKDYAGKQVHLICVLKGGVFFMCELAKRITVPVSMDFMSVSSYGDGTKSSGVVKIAKDLDETLEGKDVLIVEDIIDSGRTLYYLMDILAKRKPKSMKLCTLLDKPERRVKDVKVDYVGFNIPDEFVVGYGLDYAQRYRNLPFIGVVEGVE